MDAWGGVSVGGVDLLRPQPAHPRHREVPHEREGCVPHECGHVLCQGPSGGKTTLQRLPNQTCWGHGRIILNYPYPLTTKPFYVAVICTNKFLYLDTEHWHWCDKHVTWYRCKDEDVSDLVTSHRTHICVDHSIPSILDTVLCCWLPVTVSSKAGNTSSLHPPVPGSPVRQ